MHRRRITLPSGLVAELCFTTRAEGDFAVDAPAAALHRARQRVAPGPWTWMRQEHGARVVVVEEPGAHAGAHADAAVTVVPGAVLAVGTADCVPVALVDAHGAVGVVHAGWRGIVAGVVPNAVDALRALGDGDGDVQAVVGPCIHAGCYEFGDDDLAMVMGRVGPSARGTTTSGATALDLVAATRAELDAAGVREVHVIDDCTSCRGDRYFSHRARGDRGRQVVTARLERVAAAPSPGAAR